MPWLSNLLFFFFNDTATTEIYTLSLHDALPISDLILAQDLCRVCAVPSGQVTDALAELGCSSEVISLRSEEHTSELQSLAYLVCRLLLEKKKSSQQLSTVRHSALASAQAVTHQD